MVGDIAEFDLTNVACWLDSEVFLVQLGKIWIQFRSHDTLVAEA